MVVVSSYILQVGIDRAAVGPAHSVTLEVLNVKPRQRILGQHTPLDIFWDHQLERDTFLPDDKMGPVPQGLDLRYVGRDRLCVPGRLLHNPVRRKSDVNYEEEVSLANGQPKMLIIQEVIANDANRTDPSMVVVLPDAKAQVLDDRLFFAIVIQLQCEDPPINSSQEKEKHLGVNFVQFYHGSHYEGKFVEGGELKSGIF